MSKLSQPQFHDEEAAILHLESIIWPQGANCPHCGSVERLGRLKGKSVRPGLWKCYNCRKQFTVKVGTVFESSHVPLTKWLQAVYLMASSKKGISAHQLHRILEVQYNTAWFMAHRLREAMRELHIEPMGGEGVIVEADETYLGGLEKNKHAKDRKKQGRGPIGKEAVFSLVERGGKVRSTHVQSVNAETLGAVMSKQLFYYLVLVLVRLMSRVIKIKKNSADRNPLNVGNIANHIAPQSCVLLTEMKSRVEK